MKNHFFSTVKEANAKGTGFLSLPKKGRDSFQLGDRVKIKLSDAIEFFARIVKWGGWGVYVPKDVMAKSNLLNKEVEVQIQKIDGFYSKIGKDGRIYIPEDIVKRHNLQEDDVVLVKGSKEKDVLKKKYCRIYLSHKKRETADYICTFAQKFHGKNLVFQIEKEDNKELKSELSSAIATVIEDMQYTFTDKNSLIIFKGNKVPAIIPTKVDLSDIAFYFGAYFTDGTKKGNNWAICASTFKQGRYYLKIHNLLVKDSDPEFIVSYTKLSDTSFEKAERRLRKQWESEVGVEIDRFRIRNPVGKNPDARNRSKIGTLVIREPRQILIDVYRKLLNILIDKIITEGNTELAMNFLFGVLEGDGSVPAKKRGHIHIYANKEESEVLEEILEITEMKFKKFQEGSNKYGLRIGALEILRNFDYFKERAFILYPKRRKALFKRMQSVGVVKFLMGDHKPCSWVKAWLKDNGFVDESYNLSKKGKELQENLEEGIRVVQTSLIF